MTTTTTETWRVIVRAYDDNVEDHVIGTGMTVHKLERVADGVERNLDHENFYVIEEPEQP